MQAHVLPILLFHKTLPDCEGLTKCFQFALFGRFCVMLAYVVALFAYSSSSNIPRVLLRSTAGIIV